MNDLSEYINSKIFRLICKASHELGYKTYVIGGYVRDIFYKENPTTSTL